MNRKLVGSVGDNLESRFVTPYDVGWGFLTKFNHDFRGRETLEKIAENPPREATTLEWNPDDIGAVFAEMFKSKNMEVNDISKQSDFDMTGNSFFGQALYHADKVLADGKEIGITTGRIISYNYNSMISLGFIDPDYTKEGTELTILWGTPGTKQMKIRAKVAKHPYNSDFIRNENKDVEDIPRLNK